MPKYKNFFAVTITYRCELEFFCTQVVRLRKVTSIRYALPCERRNKTSHKSTAHKVGISTFEWSKVSLFSFLHKSIACWSTDVDDFNSQTRSTDSLQGAAEEHWKHSASWEAPTKDQENTLNPLVHFHTRAHGRFYIYRNIFNEFHETTKKKRKISFEFINSSNNNNNNNNNMTMVTWFEYVIPINADLRLNFSVKTVLTEKLYETVRAFVSAQIQTPQKLLKTFSDSVFQVAFP